MAERDALVEVIDLFKVFGPEPDRARELLRAGQSKDEIFESTGMTVGVDDVSFKVRRGECFVVMGLSGSGKSTLLRLLNRLIEPTSGTVRIGGKDVTAMRPSEVRELRRRELGMVFQSFALMPHLNVWQNAAFGLDVAGVSRRERKQRALAALDRVGLRSHADSRISELSGGMQQRVGLARGLAVEPSVLLMDEAFSALDPLIRSEMQEQLIELQRERARTIVFVSHDLDEAMRIGDRIAIMDAGRVIQIGTPEDILENPENDFVRSFFTGVDVKHVYHASDLAQSDDLVVVDVSEVVAEGAIAAMGKGGHAFAYACDGRGRFLGMLSADALRDEDGAQDRPVVADDLEPADPLETRSPMGDVMARVVNSPWPVPVVSERGRFEGAVSKRAVLSALTRRS